MSSAQILVHLTSHRENRDLVLDSDLTEHLFGDAVVFSSDKKLRRQASAPRFNYTRFPPKRQKTNPRHLLLCTFMFTRYVRARPRASWCTWPSAAGTRARGTSR